MADELDFDDITVVEIPVRFQGKRYVLREASEEATIKYRATQFRDAKLVDGKVSANMERMQELGSLLVSMCLFDEADKPVSLQTIRGWPRRVVEPLHQRALQISKLDDNATAEALEKQLASTQERLDALRNINNVGKNSPSATAST